ncbi:TRAP transporter large permease subunit [Rhodobacter sphaeroides]|mgnify:CR=1 FL=1|jgi:TRAP transporter, DctM subunit|uniref:TRAP transporter large permease protein n=1 Tax=Cereibacter sphaeroides (strain ATCC 17023 / DSM 158 / JCM 6121 / CCUG 31486 / LMG 2827 / NBRC 12203 / NCIMB 8253 / ATH 2.4.1.) TaxID=272943 RepID=Q3J076_CERS4|nr:TRAP transporter large permease [Cereibacter sphaeroides]ABA79808.1 TRAP-T family transporter, DctM (12 TMs) subunit [Cereibacter sphaeroides 2.4.1]AMJ48082.1 C4-dicarboxylate ABC transporter [Cereibacter sphaeroides]ANS34792.1 C4-dicarboxylate ABC transporter [Cereibacter sphaeroides]ATN63841.1 C4-dicarboxylate ABC transporter [Cereibacter sphaeroides]AXC62015.1 TRAP transporter large permease [Cereibacter sphaeroides 2.4.1]
MSNVAIGFTGIGIGLILLALRVQIGVALGLVSFVGIGILLSWRAAWGIVTAIPFNFVGDWNLTAIPMFLLMGFVASEAGLSSGLFRAMRILLSWLPGGLAVSSVGANAVLAAASGSSVATASAFARIATPEMLRYGYHPGLATGVIAAAGTLGALIPPSILMVLYGYLAEVSIAQLFAAGIVPGILTALAFSAMIVVRCLVNPRLAPRVEDRFTRAEKLAAFQETWPLPVIILGVLCGIFVGFFTPTAAGAVGAALAILLGLLRGKIDFAVMKRATEATLMSTASIFLVIIGTSLLGKFMAISGVPAYAASLLIEFGTTQLMVLLAVSLLYIFLGMFLDSMGILLLTMPIILPMAREAGLDLIFFGIILVKLLEIGLLTPPVGLNVYIIKGALGDRVSLTTIFKGVGWFIAVDLVLLAILVEWPVLVTGLPSLMF